MATVEELNFKLLVDDTGFNQRIKQITANAQKLNVELSRLLSVQARNHIVTAEEVKNAERLNQLLNERNKIETKANNRRKKKLDLEREITVELERQAKIGTLPQTTNYTQNVDNSRTINNMRQAQAGYNAEVVRSSKLWRELKNITAAYFSVMGATRIISNLVQVSAEFELQRTTLAAILQDAEKAEQLYGQIKELAVLSPFSFKELASYAKQLSAYSIPVNELYETTKMLADVSAGLGVGMDRLVLAYGQIRSASFLRGQEVRQLTEAGIPILEELRKQFVELGEEGITVGEVFDKISSRMVPFSMVERVFKDMTSEGGKFFNMQEVQAETLKGKLSNLTDAYQIMFSEIGDKNSRILKGSVDVLRGIAENYEKIGRIITTVAVSYGAYRAALIAAKVVEEAMVQAHLGHITTMGAMGSAIKVLTAQSGKFAAIQKFISSINPYAFLAASLTAVIGLFVSSTIEANKYKRELEEIANVKFNEARKAADNFKALAEKLKSSTEGSHEYREAISQINRQYGEYLPHLLSEKNALSEILVVEKQVTNAIYARARAYAEARGAEKIEEQFGDKLEKQSNIFMNTLANYRVGNTVIGKEAAADFIAGFGKKLRENGGDPFEMFQTAAKEYFGQEFKNFSRIVLTGYADVIRDMNKATENFQRTLDMRDGGQAYSTFLERQVTEPFEESFRRQVAALDKASMSEEEYQERVNSLNLTKLYMMKSEFEDLNAELAGTDNEGAWNNTLTRIQQDIDAIKPAKLEYLQKMVNGLVTGAGNDDLKAGALTQYEDYVNMLRKEYKSVTENYADASASYNKLNSDKQKGVAVDEVALAKLKEMNDRYEERKRVIENIGKTLGLTFNSTNGGGKAGSVGSENRVKDIQAEIDMYRELRKTRDEFLQYLDAEGADKVMAQLFPGFDSNANYDEIVQGLIANLKTMGEEGQKAAAKIEESLRNEKVKAMLKEYEETAKREEEFQQRITGYYQEARTVQQKMADLKRQMADDLAAVAGDQIRSAVIIAHYTGEFEKLEDELANLTQISLTDFWQQLSGDKGGYSYNSLERIRKQAIELQDVLKKIDPNRNSEGKITGYTITKQNAGGLAGLLGITDDNGQISVTVAQVAQLAKIIDDINGQKSEKSGIRAVLDLIKEKGGLRAFVKGLKDGKDELLAIKSAGEEIGKLGGMLTELGDALGSSALSSAGESFSLIGDVVSNLASNDYLGAIGGIVSAVASWITAERELREAIHETALEAERQNVAAKLADGVSTIFGTNNRRAIENARALLNEYGKLTKADASKYTANYKLKWGDFFGDYQQSLKYAVEKLGYELYDSYGNLNASALQALLDTYKNLKSADKAWIEDAIKNSELYAQAMEQLDAELSNLYNQTLDNVADALVESWKSAGNAALDYADILDDVATSYAKMMIKEALIDNIFTPEIEDRIRTLSKEGDFESALSLLEQKLQEAAGMEQTWNTILSGISQYLGEGEESSDSLASGIKSITEDTANLLAAYVNAIRADVAYNRMQFETLNNDNKLILGLLPNAPTLAEYLTQIQANTYNTAENTGAMLSELRSMMTSETGATSLRVVM